MASFRLAGEEEEDNIEEEEEEEEEDNIAPAGKPAAVWPPDSQNCLGLKVSDYSS